MADEQVTLSNGEATTVVTMGLCEVPHLMLRPDQLYRFVVMPGCEKCAAAAAPYQTPQPVS